MTYTIRSKHNWINPISVSAESVDAAWQAFVGLFVEGANPVREDWDISEEAAG